VDECTLIYLLPRVNEKKRYTLATSMPLTPASSDPVSRRTHSQWGAVIPLVFHLGVDRIVSRYSPPMPEGLLGGQKMALAEWNTDISLTASTVGALVS
jgi:hypothetical protein